ncbi:MAG: branched-chain amino acid ABC transporter permease [Pseudomonadota bacterium]
MLQAIFYGLTIGGILYITSIGLSLTFGAMRIVNFAHGMVYSVGAYTLFFVTRTLGLPFLAGAVVSVLLAIPLSYVIERLVIRRLYGQSIDYAIVATYAVLLIGVDVTKWIFGPNPLPISVPMGESLTVGFLEMPVYRLVIIGLSLLIFMGLSMFFKKTIIGKIVVAGLQDREAVRSLGIDIDKYFAIVFVLGSALAALGGVLYAPLSTIQPYMGFQVLVLTFAVVIVGGMGNFRGTAVSAYGLGLVIAITGRFWGPAAEAMVFVIMALVLAIRPIEA